MNTKFNRGSNYWAMSMTAIAMGAMLVAGCDKNENSAKSDTKPGAQAASTPMAVSVEKNSFQAVTSQLDAGGNLYGYLSTEQWLTGLSGKVAGLQDFFKDIPGMSQDDRATLSKVFNVVTSLIQHCGIEDISGVGMSSIMKEQGIYRSKFVLHHYPGKGAGFLWSLFGDKAHALKGMEMLPATTALASFSDFDLAMLWSVIQKEVDNAGFPEASDALKQVPQQFEGVTGLKFAEVLASLGNEYGLIITLDDSRKISIPIGDQRSMSVPEPGILLVIKVKNDLIFNRIDTLINENLKDNPALIKTEKDGLKMRTMPVPVPLPIDLRPSIARSGDYLFIASSDALVLEAVDVMAGRKPGLKAGEEYKRISHDMPVQGNQFAYVSERFGKTITDIQMQALQTTAHGDQAMVPMIQKLLNMSSAASGFSVSANGPEGWLTTGNGNRNPANMLLLPAIAIPAIAAGVALPAVARARMATH